MKIKAGVDTPAFLFYIEAEFIFIIGGFL